MRTCRFGGDVARRDRLPEAGGEEVGLNAGDPGLATLRPLRRYAEGVGPGAR